MAKTTNLEELEKFKKAGVDPNTPGLWETKWQCGDRVVVKNKVTDEERPHEYTQQEKEMIKNGDFLQPFQKDAYIKKYGTLPGENQKDVDKYILRHASMSDFKNRRRGFDKKWY